MIRSLLVLVAAFAVSSGLGIAIHGCDMQRCRCPEPLPRPEAQGPLAGLKIEPTQQGQRRRDPRQPEDGTIEVTGDNVAISYQQAGVRHRVGYDVTGR